MRDTGFQTAYHSAEDTSQFPVQPGESSHCLGASPSACMEKWGGKSGDSRTAEAEQLQNTYCCREIPNCWLGRGGRGGAAFWLADGGFIVERITLSYLE